MKRQHTRRKQTSRDGAQNEKPLDSEAPSGKKARSRPTVLPVTLLGGFLGAGKTTLMKHVLETKHGEGGGEAFKCAVIVNDMAELNIDKDLIDQTAFVQSDEVIAMQNGCVCCTLKSDLVEQMIALAKKNVFDYMIIEASGVSEPSQIASLFVECEKDHDHETEHKDAGLLTDVARLDACVTVVDAGEFFANLESVIAGPNAANFPVLLVEQIEYSNIIILNKTDLVSKAQLAAIEAQVSTINSKAKILTAKNAVVDVSQVMNTGLYDPAAFKIPIEQMIEPEVVPECCKRSVERGETPCCKRARTLDSGKSQVLLSSKKLPTTRHQKRFSITSFLYKARRPFHPLRFHESFVEKFFVFVEQGARNKSEGDEDSEENGEDIKRRQEDGAAKQVLRTSTFGKVLRSKGFLWIASRHDMVNNFGQAGNIVTIDGSGVWKALDPAAWTGSEEEKATLRKDFVVPWGDRRQEIVFIGQDLKHDVIQKSLDECLLTDEEFAMGLDGWKATIGDMFLDNDDDEDDDDEDDDDAVDEEMDSEE
ncbi:hypothetical protein CYMTET_50358 [Cymbomonas tetramitiformis]|uniref:CobW C-terminal domain-containing protein n=1 Tax=Cymbomonas tetramitiformis TaxID=36881 RepID=A0AAE0ET72_9CHLO|nr:hypothetical protein CYMTET_50358 [Cymbomonas tetramitiformis]